MAHGPLAATVVAGGEVIPLPGIIFVVLGQKLRQKGD
jgi:hypothetical protein